METKEKIALIEKLVEDYKKFDPIFDNLGKVFKQVEGDLFDSVYTMLDNYVKSVSIAVLDPFEWVAWYLYENDCGKKGLKVSIHKESKKIKSVKDLVKFMEIEQVS